MKRNTRFNIKEYRIEADLVLFYEEAFAEDATHAFVKLKEKLGTEKERKFYGITSNVEGVLTFRAAVEEITPGEGDACHCPYFVIPAGKYLSVILDRKDLAVDANDAFDALRHHPLADDSEITIEFYKSVTKLVCLIKSRAIQMELAF